MTDASVAFLLDDLHELLINHAHLIKDNKKDLESLEKQLRDLKTFIRNTEKKRIKDDELIRNIRCAVYEAEDVIDAFVDAVQRSYFEALEFESSYLSKRAASIVFPKFWRSSWFSITGIGKKVKEVTQNLMSLMDGAHSLNIDDDGDKHENSKSSTNKVHLACISLAFDGRDAIGSSATSSGASNQVESGGEVRVF
ncbi:hypothetical protein SASPL_132936 [Salvia splendens]|uniref:Disease resistance N-terminal domain-containing protein n=1 Tax=Salvia splendens TaxID=180675 RepID=A0A8X8ZHL7_SALSN|nr:hypothetical protein SASPL_132936 [Salvia splendens]